MRRKPKAKLYLRFRMPDGKQSPNCPALFDNKSRIRPFWCLVKGTPEHHPEATYHKRVKREGKWGWESVGNDANTAAAKVSAANVSFPVSTEVPDKLETPTVKECYRIDGEIAVYPSNAAKLTVGIGIEGFRSAIMSHRYVRSLPIVAAEAVNRGILRLCSLG